MKRKIKILQFLATSDYETNLKTIQRLADKGEPADILITPELGACHIVFRNQVPLVEEHFESFCQFYKTLAIAQKCWVIACLPEPAGDGKIHNLLQVYDPTGNVKSEYRKIHLFDVHVPEDKLVSRESLLVKSGKPAGVVVEVAGIKIGLAICYDLRFPELFRDLSSKGAELIVLPAAFTKSTGKLHWEILCRARAVENACYFIGANQCGEGEPFPRYGNSLVSDPWGKIQARAGTGEEVLLTEVDTEVVSDYRKKIPCLKHRRMFN